MGHLVTYHKSHAWWPDEHVYLMTAARLSTQGRFTFDSPEEDVQPVIAFYQRTESGAYGPDYPPGLPVLLAIAHKALGPAACTWTNSALAMAGVLLTYGVFRRLLGVAPAIAGASLLAINPAYLLSANGIMSDMAGAVLVAASVMGALMASGAKRRWARLGGLFGSGLVAGMAFLTRLSAGIGFLPGLWVCLAGVGPPARLRRRFASSLFFLFGFGLAAGLLALYLQLVLGQLRSPYVDISAAGFSLANVRPNGKMMLDTLLSPRSGGLLAPAAAGLALLLWRKPRVAGLVLLWILPIAGIHLLYLVRNDTVGYIRFLLIGVPPMAALAGYLLTTMARGITWWWPRAMPWLLGALTVAACLVGLRNSVDIQAEREIRRTHAPTLVRTVDELVPEGSTLFGWRPRLSAVAFYRYGRYECVVLNQFEADRPNPFALGSGAVWRGTMYTFRPDWEQAAKANRHRITARLREKRRVFVLINARNRPAVERSFGMYYETTTLEGDSGFAVVELRPRRSRDERRRGERREQRDDASSHPPRASRWVAATLR